MLLRTLFVWAAGLPLTLLFFMLLLLSRLIDREGRIIHSLGAVWSRAILALAGVRVAVKGVENVPRSGPVIFLSNHQGAFDIPALQASLPLQFRWVAKKSLFKIPVLGWAMSLAGYIGIEREQAAEAYRSMEHAALKIKSGTSVLVFPEGTRSETGALLPFKRGAFMLARKSGAPVVPIAIKGTMDIMRKGSLLIKAAPVSIIIGTPIETAEKDEKEIRSAAKQAIERFFREGQV